MADMTRERATKLLDWIHVDEDTADLARSWLDQDARLAEFLAADKEHNATIDEQVRTINRLGSDYYRLRDAACELLSVVDEEHPDWQPARLSMAMQTVREAISSHVAGTVAAVHGRIVDTNHSEAPDTSGDDDGN